jgi:hypothetical protein
LSYTAGNLEIFSIKKSQDFLSLSFCGPRFSLKKKFMNHNVDDDNKNKRCHLLAAAVAASLFSSSKGKKLTFVSKTKRYSNPRLELKFGSARASIIISFK